MEGDTQMKTLEEIVKMCGWTETAGLAARKRVWHAARSAGVDTKLEGRTLLVRDDDAEALVGLLKEARPPKERRRHIDQIKEEPWKRGGESPPAMEVPKMEPIGFKTPGQEFEVKLRSLLNTLKAHPALGIDSVEIEKENNGDWKANIQRTVTVTKEEVFK
jgi:hypothetical protein